MQGVYKFNEANFQEISRRDFKKNPGHVCFASPSFGGDIPIVWVFQLSVSPPQPNRNLGEHHKSIISSPTGVRGRVPAENWNLKEHI